MTEYKCRACNSNAMRVEKCDTCGNCEFNGFMLDDEIIKEFNMPEQCTFDQYYNEDLRQNASKLLGMNIERDEAYNGSCKMGEPMERYSDTNLHIEMPDNCPFIKDRLF